MRLKNQHNELKTFLKIRKHKHYDKINVTRQLQSHMLRHNGLEDKVARRTERVEHATRM